MTTYSAGFHTQTPNIAWGGTVDVDNTRRTFDISNKVAFLEPAQNLFFAYLSQFAKQSVAETVWKPLEGRHQWQRRDFCVNTAFNGGAAAAELSDKKISVNYDVYGKLVNNTNPGYSARYTWAPIWKLVNQVVAITDDEGDMYHFKITTVDSDGGTDGTDGYAQIHLTCIESSSGKTFPAYSWDGTTGSKVNGLGQVIGTQVGETGTAPDGWRDKFKPYEFYAQRFRTAVPLFSDSAMATEYRGVKNEFQRVWDEHVLSHDMDISNALLYGYGKYVDKDERYSWGMIPYTNLYGKVYSMTYASSKYSDMLDLMEDFMAPEIGGSGDKLVLTSRKIISWLNKLDVGHSFLGNTIASANGQSWMDIQNIGGTFGHEVTRVKTAFGRLHFVQEVLLRGPGQDYAIMVDLANVKLRPVVGNGISLDTYVRTNIQDNSQTGRKDEIITEAGLQIDLAETHGLIRFS